MSQEIELLKEIRQRLTRTESRVVQLGDHVGANLREKAVINIAAFQGHVQVTIDAMDISVSRIYTELREQGVCIPDEGAHVFMDGELVFTLFNTHPTTKAIAHHD